MTNKTLPLLFQHNNEQFKLKVSISEKHLQGGTPQRPLKKSFPEKGFHFQLSIKVAVAVSN